MPKLEKLKEEDLKEIHDMALTLMKDFPVSYDKLPEFKENKQKQTYCFTFATLIFLKKKGIIEEKLEYKTKHHIRTK